MNKKKGKVAKKKDVAEKKPKEKEVDDGSSDKSGSSSDSNSSGSSNNSSQKSDKSGKSSKSGKSQQSKKTLKAKEEPPKDLRPESAPEPIEDMEFSIPINCPDYVKEIIEGFKDNKEELFEAYGKGIITKDIYIFEKTVETILGAEIDILRNYILQKYKTDKDKYKIKFNEFQKLIQEWADFESREKDLNDELHDDAASVSLSKRLPPTEEDSDAEDMELETKENFKKLVELKIEKHFEKIREIFENYTDKTEDHLEEQVKLEEPEAKNEIESKKSNASDSGDESDNHSKNNSASEKSDKKSQSDDKSDKSEDEESKHSEIDDHQNDENQIILPNASGGMGFQKTNVKLSKIGKILNDISYLTGLGIMTVDESHSHNRPKRTSAKAIDEFTHFVWLEKHMNYVKEKQSERIKKTILKNALKPKKQEETDDANHSDSDSDVGSKEDNVSEKDKKPAKADKKKSKKKASKKSEQSHSQKSGSQGSSSGGDSDAEEEVKQPLQEKERAIQFEDEKFRSEQDHSEMAYEDFQAYLLAFIDKSCTYQDSERDDPDLRGRDLAHRLNECFVVVDLNEEFEDDVSDQSPVAKLKKVEGSDKLTRKLQKTIFEYESLIERDDFGSLQEKNDTQKLLRSLRTQLEHHVHSKRPKKEIQETLEERRNRALEEIFHFYAKQHVPPGLPFEELEETLKTINIGELLVFCKDFGVEIPRSNLMLIYKKESDRNHPHKFPQFLQSLHKIALYVHKRKLVSKKKRFRELKKLLGEETVKHTETGSHHSSHSGSGSEGEGSDSENEKDNDSKKEIVKDEKDISPKKGKKGKKAEKESVKESEKPKPSAKSKSQKSAKSKSKAQGSDHSGSDSDSNSDTENISQSSHSEVEAKEEESEIGNKLEQEKDALEDEILDMQEKTEDEIYEDFIHFLEIDHPAKYKRKAKGLRLAFDVKDQHSRIPIGMDDTKSKRTTKRMKISAQEIKEKVRKMKEDRLNKKIEKEFTDQVKYQKNRETMKLIHEKLRHEKKYEPKLNKMSYSSVQKKQAVNPSWENPQTKVTLDLLTQMHYSDFNIEDEDDFKPSDILDDEDMMLLEQKKNRMRGKIKSIHSLNSAALTDNPPKAKTGNKRGIQMNQSQMAHNRNRSSMNAKKNHKPMNQAYDYTLGRVKDSKKSMSVNRSSNYLNNKAGSHHPRSKQVMMNNRLNIGKSQDHLKKNRSMHYQRPPVPNTSMGIHNSYQPASQKKLPLMKKQMRDRMKQIEIKNRAKERQSLDGIMRMHDKQIKKGMKTLNKNQYGI